MRQPVIGPRGGIHTADVQCLTCVCDPHRCGYAGPITRGLGLGCPDWVSLDGERIPWPIRHPFQAPLRLP